MRSDTRIQRHSDAEVQTRSRPQQDQHRSGVWNGQPIRQVPAKDVDDTLQINHFKHEKGLGYSIDNKPLAQRKVRLDQEQRLSLKEIRSYDAAVGSQKKTAELATQYLRYFKNKATPDSIANQSSAERPKRDAGIQALMQHYIGLQKLAAGLRGGNDKLLAMLTPLQEHADSLEDIAGQMQEAGEDREKLAKLFANVEGCQIDEESLFQMMRTLRFQPKELGQKLRTLQRLPSLSSDENDALLEETEDALREFERTDGLRIRASLNSHHAARESSDAENFIEGYNELIENNGGFAKSLENLLSRFKPAELLKVLPLMKQAVGEDLSAELRSTDKIKLEFLLSELAYMQIMSTVINMVENLASSMQRLYSENQRI